MAKSVYFTGAFWLASFERAVKSFAGGLLAAFGTAVTNILNIDWQQSLGIAGFAALASILLSVTSAQIGNKGPSLGGEVLKPKE